MISRIYWSAAGYFMPCVDNSSIGEYWGIRTAYGYVPIYDCYSRADAEKRIVS